MIKEVRTYKDLLEERRRLREILAARRIMIKGDFDELKEEFAPVGKVVNVIGNLTTKDKSNPALNAGLDLIIDLLLRRIVLSRAGLITRLAVPFFVKNYSSHLLSDDKASELFSKFKKLFKKRKHSPQAEIDTRSEETPYSSNIG